MPEDTQVESISELMSLPEAEFAKHLNLSTEAAPTTEPAPGAQKPESATSPETPSDAAPTQESEAALDARGETGAEPPVADKPETKTEEAKTKEVQEEIKPEDTKPLLTKFSIFDSEGDEVELPPVMIEYKANGRIKRESLDKVVLLAQMGDYNQEREAQVTAAKKFVPQVMQENDTLKRQLEEYDGWFQRVFDDEEFYTKSKERFQANNAPEARADRAEAQLAEARRQSAINTEVGQAVQYSNQFIVPAIERVMKTNPLVSEQEVLGHYNQLVAPLLYAGGGRVPFSRLPEVRQLVEHDLETIVKSRQLSLEEGQRKTTQKVAAAQTTAQIAKRQVAKVTAPQGSAPGAPKPKSQFDSVGDWLNTMFPQHEG